MTTQTVDVTSRADFDWLHRLTGSDAVGSLVASLSRSPRQVARGAAGSSTHLLAGAVALRSRRPVLLVVAHLDEADDAVEDMALFSQAGMALNIQRFGALEVLPGESGVSLELLAERLGVVEMLHGGSWPGPDGTGVIVAPIQALMQSVPQPQTLADYQLTLERGGRIAPGQLLEWLDRSGYTRADVVEQPGDFATRGGIVDLYLPSAVLDDGISSNGPLPVRVDFFGDEIDTLHIIDTDTMGSGNPLRRVRIIGASAERLQSDDRTTTLLNLLPPDTLPILSEVMELSEQARGYYERLTDARGIYPPNRVFQMLTSRAHIEVNQYSAATHVDSVHEMPVQALEAFEQDAAQAMTQLGELAARSEVVALCNNEAERDRLVELLTQHAPKQAGRITLMVGYLHRGFVWDPALGEARTADRPPLHLVPHHELFHRYHTRRRIRRVTTAASAERASDAFVDLAVGDLVVHVEHGIGLFRGLKTMKRSGRSEDYLTLEFADKALLHVPAAQIELVQKYIGGFEGRPPLSMLGGKKWAKQKQAASEAAKDLAKQMLQIQAARAALPGIRFPADTPWQKEFEAEFPYTETDDQLSAIAAIKRDMGDDQPMDRLICGDVGFGKTEVAIRAAFKAVESGKQVAVLVPTTVLAEQHERTFSERMADYPFNIASLSRFKTAMQQKATLEKVAHGQIDVVIGTHRLLSKDVRFADLGLVIIDEEQRFGVEHKQRLLQFRMTADVLTLSATPIPRTLHMSMLGLRDISSLSTAPLDRRAIVTEVIPYNAHRIKQALVRELNRDGQVFFVHNRVYDIQTMADEVQRMVPDARIIVGHGQMSSRELERVMLRFVRRQADILVSTTIIESGIDIPTANTIIINNADHFGLAELHQLRGRVGRYKHRAYCYLLLPPDRPLNDTAHRRLKAIEQYSMLGAGFKIAMRDLEIRGAGNLLGAEQSGHIAAVGYQLYCMLLEQEARRLKDEKVIEPMKTHLELPVAGRIESRYIPSEKYRMQTYRQLSRVNTLEALDEVAQHLIEAYGPMPAITQTLIDLAELRIAASTFDIEGLKLEAPDLIFTCRQPTKLEPLLKEAPGRTTLIDERKVYWRPPTNYLEPASTLLAVLRKLLVRPLRPSSA